MHPSLVHAWQVDASTQRVLHGKSESGFGNQPSRFIPQIVLAKAVQEGNVNPLNLREAVSDGRGLPILLFSTCAVQHRKAIQDGHDCGRKEKPEEDRVVMVASDHHNRKDHKHGCPYEVNHCNFDSPTFPKLSSLGNSHLANLPATPLDTLGAP